MHYLSAASRNIEACSLTHCLRGKARSVACSVLVYLVVQHTKRMRPIVLSVACTDLRHLSTLSHNRYDFLGGGARVCFDFQYNFCLKHFSFKEEPSEILP